MPIHVTKHKIDQEWRSKISSRYKAVTKAFNSVFWESDSETAHSRYLVIWTFYLSCLQKNISDGIKQNGMDNHVCYRL